ncbi:hypothetical protein N7517_004673 [Penicillium concentricum]|uniref:Uncharacterized protein n=1 Tax=Penicillium concentricum TaxID=293559 RepID=A0A9W9S5Y3_9EURO|nr:uncharacterized protein N7517_004673 [Penicillium concentricum]KAJ5372667.1 hypothetical protein N7517_004673 [Penicillium concentricum]
MQRCTADASTLTLSRCTTLEYYNPVAKVDHRHWEPQISQRQYAPPSAAPEHAKNYVTVKQAELAHSPYKPEHRDCGCRDDSEYEMRGCK